MTSLFFDTNALIYWINPNAGTHEEVDRLVGRAVERGAMLFTGACQLNEVYYVVARRYLPEPQTRELLEDIADVFSLVSLDEQTVRHALTSDEPDYEDGLVCAMAERVAADALVSYDLKAFNRSHVPKLDAAQALALPALAGR